MRIFQMVGADAQGRMAGNFATEQDYRDVAGRLDMRTFELEQSKAREAALQALLNERDELTDAYSAAIAASNELGYACMDAASVIRSQGDQLSSAREFVRNLVESSAGQGSVATGYLSDILERLL